METKELIKELRILEKSSKLGEQACICGEAASRLEELQQEIEIARRLEKIKDRRLNSSSNTIFPEDKENSHLVKNVMKPLKSLLEDDRKLYITGFDYEITPCILDVDESLLNGWVGDYFVHDLMILKNDIYVAQIDLSNLVLKTWVQKYGCKEALYTLKEKRLL